MKSILLHVYDDTALESRLQACFDLARAFGGSLTFINARWLEEHVLKLVAERPAPCSSPKMTEYGASETLAIVGKPVIGCTK